MKEKDKPDWMITKPLGKLKDDRPEECKSCDHDFYEDCQEGCMRLKEEICGSGNVRFPFKCTRCNYGMSLTSGVPACCPICEGFICFVRITWDQYKKLKNTDGFDEQ